MADGDDKINGTTGGFTSAGLKTEEEMLVLPAFDIAAALEIGQIAFELASARELKAAIEVRIGEWVVFHASLPGTNSENDWWMGRKARVVLLTGHSSIHERVLAEETNTDWFAKHGVLEEQYAIHGGGLPINVVGKGLVGVLLVSGLPQIQDHLLGVEVLTEYLARKGENS
ncbi:COG4702 Uncharacterized conserved protein [actinobacterium SCGC AAA044-D11]